MTRILPFAVFLILLQCVLPCRASAAPTAEQTVAYLIKYTADSKLTFIRNGSEHTSEEAAQLMQRKYDYVKAEVHTPEDFIRLAASKSHLSGKPYLVKMAGGKTVPAADWLGAVLRDYRAAHSK